jgi:hypothetical protein
VPGIETTTGADGVYRIEVPPHCAICADAVGYLQSCVNVDAAGSVPDHVLRRGAVTRGKVVGADDKPVASARVTLGRVSGPEAFTGLDGRYVLHDVPAHRGTLTTLAKMSGFMEQETTGFVVPEGGDVEAPILRLSRGITLTGVVRRSGGTPAASAKVRIDDGPRSTRTDAEGRFEFGAIPIAAGVTLLVSSADAATTRRTVPLAKPQPASRDDSVTMEAAPHVSVEIVLRPATERSGTVKDAAGKPVAGARVETVGEIVGADGDDAFFEGRNAETDAQGRFVLSGLPPGAIRVHVRAEGFRIGSADLTGRDADIPLVPPTADELAQVKAIDAELRTLDEQIDHGGQSTDERSPTKRRDELQAERKRLLEGEPPPAPVSPSTAAPGAGKCGEGKCG